MWQNFKINMIETMPGLYDQIGNEENHLPSNPFNIAHLNTNSANNLSLSNKAIFQLLKTLEDKVEALSTNNNKPYSQVENSQVKKTRSGPVNNHNTGRAYKPTKWNSEIV